MIGDVIAMIDDQMSRSAMRTGGRRGQLFLHLKEQQKTRIRPLVNLSFATPLAIHNRYHPDISCKVYAVCAREIGRNCSYCQRGNRGEQSCAAEVSFMLPVFVYMLTDTRTNRQIMYHDQNGLEQPVAGMRLLELTAFGTIRDVLATFSAFVHAGGNIAGCDWTLEQFVGAQGRSIVTTPMTLEPLSPQIEALIPTKDVVRKCVLEFAPPMIYNATAPTATPS